MLQADTVTSYGTQLQRCVLDLCPPASPDPQHLTAKKTSLRVLLALQGSYVSPKACCPLLATLVGMEQ